MSNPDQVPRTDNQAPLDLSLERMKALLAYSWDILSLLDAEGRLIYNSPAAQRLHGFEPGEMEGKSTFAFFHPEDAGRVGETFLACLARPGEPFRVEYRYACKDGSWLWMEAVAVNLLDTPEVRAIVVNSRDISARMAGQRALRESERFADRTLDALRANLAVLDEQGRILKVNQGWRNFAATGGLPPDTRWEGVSYLEVCERAADSGSEEARATAEGIRALLRGEISLFTLEYFCPAPEEPRWFQARLNRFQDEGPARVVVSHLDITNLKQAETERLQLERMLHRTQKMESLGSLAGGVAHDMNNVLGSILGMASMHLEVQPRDSAAHQAFSIITKACQRGGGLVRRLLDFARQDLSETRVVDLNLLIQEEVQLLERTTLGRVRCALALAPDLGLIRGDANALIHAVMNLCLNAVDAMPQGGDLTLRTRPGSPGWVELEVEDSGQGMSKDVMDRALDPFFTTKPPNKGTGLGLAIVYGTVSAHHGTMELQSEPGRGTKVILRFPALAPAGPQGGLLAEPEPGPTAADLEVLLVDDDELIQDTLASMLRSLGHRVHTARSGEEALERLRAGLEPQVVILDINMPGLGGQGTLPRLRDLRPDLPVLLATGRVDQAALDLARAFPGVVMMAKPFSQRDLRTHLNAVAGPRG